ncbi:MAG: hypothetical protein ACKVJG_08510 [Candidatus Latescibacterota bacterium]|jgi:hypothetical protein
MVRRFWPLFVCSLLGCASVSENAVLPVMGVSKGQQDEAPSEKVVVDPAKASVVAKVDSVDGLAQSLLFIPFKDDSKYKGEWDIATELPRGIADSLYLSEFFRTLSIDSALVHLDKKERKGRISVERALEVGRLVGADYVVLGQIDDLSMKRFRATVPAGGYRSYQGVTSVTLLPYKVIDGQPAGDIIRESVEDSKRYGITNPAAFVPLEKEYFMLGQMEWGSPEFRDTLLGQSVGKAFGLLAAGLDSLIKPPSELKVSSGPKIIDIDGARAYINVGLADSIANGNKYGIWDGGRELKDPDTGIVLGMALPRRVGVVQVEQVLSDHLSLVRILEGVGDVQKDYAIRAE